MTTGHASTFFFGLFNAVQPKCNLVFEDYMALVQSLPFMLENILEGAPAMQELVTVCQLLWAKDPEQERMIEQIVRKFTLDSLKAYQCDLIRQRGTGKQIGDRADVERLISEWFDPPEVSEPAGTEAVGVETPSPDIPTVTPPVVSPSVPEQASPPASPPPAAAPVDIPQPAYAYVVPPPAEPPPSVQIDIPIPLPKSVNGGAVLEYLPVTPLRLKHLWRMCRLPQRCGASFVFSLPRTMSLLERHGGLPMPAYEPSLQNRAGVLLLVDRGQHMMTFERQLRMLAETFTSSPFAHRQVAYFDTVPVEAETEENWLLYMDEKCKLELNFDDVFARLPYASVMIVSDVGAAGKTHRFRTVSEYQRLMVQFVEFLGTWATNIVWLNPRRDDAWCTATRKLSTQLKSQLESRFTMLPYTDKGIEAAIRHLRGYASI